MIRYYHNAGEYQFTVENPVEQKYYESFSGRKVLSNDQLNILLSESESAVGCYSTSVLEEEERIARKTAEICRMMDK